MIQENNKTKIEEIYDFVLPEMAENNIEDTSEHRMWFLEGLRDGWREDTDISIEKSMYMFAITAEIWKLKTIMQFPFLGKDMF